MQHLQEDITNWMHPLGFAYYPDGAHGFKQYAEVAFVFIELNATKVEVSVHINIFLLQVPELEEPHPETCNEQQFLCNPNNQSSKAQQGKPRVKHYEFTYMQVRQAPLYGIDGVFETLDNWNDGTTSGLDVYEPGFQVGMLSEPNNVLSQGAPRPME